jgi:DNA topoisomerase-2
MEVKIRVQPAIQLPVNIQPPQIRLSPTPITPATAPITISLSNDNKKESPTPTIPIKINTTVKSEEKETNEYKIVKINGSLTQADFAELSDREHVLQRPDMYLSSPLPQPREAHVYDLSTQENVKIKLARISLPQAVEQTFAEPITNCSDNIGRSYRANVDPGDIIVRADPHTVYLRNGGIPIPIEMHEGKGIMVPEMVFGRLRAGSNLGANRLEAGMNAIGIKAVNIFSKFFRVIIHDAIRKKRYQQDWRDNMSVCDPAIITDYLDDVSSVEVIYTLDLERFGYKEYPQEFFAVIAKHCADVSFTTKVKVGFNYSANPGAVMRSLEKVEDEFKTIIMDYGLIKNYGTLYHGDKAYHNSIVYYEWPSEAAVLKKRDGQQYSQDKTVVPIIEMLVIDTPEEAVIASFVNSMHVREGGCHVDSAVKAVASPIIDLVNSRASGKTVKVVKGNKNKKSTKISKKPEEKKLEKPLVKITMRDVHNHLSFIISVRVADPRFDSQSKSKLKAPNIKYSISDDDLRPVLKWQFIDRLYQILNAKNNRIIAAVDAQNNLNDKLDKGFHANMRRSNPKACTLFICEGDSAMGYMRMLVDQLGGRDYFGAIPLKGKIKNVMGETEMDLIENKELQRIAKSIGIKSQVDYFKDENRNKLKYGKIVYVTDADVDGKHITGLGLNNFFCRYPGFLESGFVYYLRTPYMRVRKGNIKHTFYTQSQYEQWAKVTPDAGNLNVWKAKYYKGLGTSKLEDVKEDCKSLWLINITCVRHEDKDALELAFNKDKTNLRKEWILKYQPIIEIGRMTKQSVTKFINNDFVQYSVANVLRSIPGFDGLKPSQRKLVYSAFSQWNIYKKGEYQEIKVGAFANYAAGKTNYHHDGAKLGEVIVRMAQSFVGANNIPYFNEDGQFGTREGNGDDAACDRYIFTSPQWWLKYVYPKDDQELLEPQNIEGEEQEPAYLLPILPMHLINGVNGVATGFSTNIPAHSPLDIIKWLLNKIEGKALPKLTPWYRGFQGSVEVIDSRKEAAEQKITLVIGENGQAKAQKKGIKSRYRVVTSGVYRRVDANTITVTEIPISRSISSYIEWMDELKTAGKIAGFVPNIFNDKPNFIIYGFENPNVQTLKLKASIGLGNMWLLDRNNRPQKYDTVTDILEYFYKERLGDYQRRINVMLNKIQAQITEKSNKWKYINLIINNQIVYIRRAKADLQKELEEKHSIPGSIITKVHTGHFTHEELLSLETDIKELTLEAKRLNETSPKMLWHHDLTVFEKAYRAHYNIAEHCGENFTFKGVINTTPSVIEDKPNDINNLNPKKNSPKLNIAPPKT